MSAPISDTVPRSEAVREPLLDVRDLRVTFDTEGGTVHAVNGVSYTLAEGETLGVVGESGSGKSVHVLAMLGLIPRPPGRIAGGQVLFRGRDLLALPERQLRRVRGAEIGFVFQDPMSSLNPGMTVAQQIVEPLRIHLGLDPLRSRLGRQDVPGVEHQADSPSEEHEHRPEEPGTRDVPDGDEEPVEQDVRQGVGGEPALVLEPLQRPLPQLVLAGVLTHRCAHVV